MAIQVKGSNIFDLQKREKALQIIQDNASTEALEFLSEMVQKPDASKKLLAKKRMIKAFL
jgi:hypothetical protein